MESCYYSFMKQFGANKAISYHNASCLVTTFIHSHLFRQKSPVPTFVGYILEAITTNNDFKKRNLMERKKKQS